jgi:hypothetical protein
VRECRCPRGDSACAGDDNIRLGDNRLEARKEALAYSAFSPVRALFLKIVFIYFEVKSLTSISPCSLEGFFREVHTVEFFAPRKKGNIKYSAKCPDATLKERGAFRPPAKPRSGLQSCTLQLQRLAHFLSHGTLLSNPRNIHNFGVS